MSSAAVRPTTIASGSSVETARTSTSFWTSTIAPGSMCACTRLSSTLRSAAAPMPCCSEPTNVPATPSESRSWSAITRTPRFSEVAALRTVTVALGPMYASITLSMRGAEAEAATPRFPAAPTPGRVGQEIVACDRPARAAPRRLRTARRPARDARRPARRPPGAAGCSGWPPRARCSRCCSRRAAPASPTTLRDVLGDDEDAVVAPDVGGIADVGLAVHLHVEVRGRAGDRERRVARDDVEARRRRSRRPPRSSS